MTDLLSPSARATYDAFNRVGLYALPSFDIDRKALGAALKAVTNQVISAVTPPVEDYNEYDQGYLAAHIHYREELLKIANELEGANG